VPHDRQMVQGIVEAKGETHDLKHGAHLNPLVGALQVARCKAGVVCRLGQRRPVDLDHRHINFSGFIDALAPDAFAIAVQ